MCLAIPGQVERLDEATNEVFRSGSVRFGHIHKEVNMCMVPEVNVGDYVLVHVGVAIAIVDEQEAQKTFEYVKRMGELDELNDGP